MTTSRTLYDVLGVPPDATPATVRQAYRQAARAHHPDTSGHADATRMAEINHAWTILGDPARRSQYDRERERELSVPAAPVSVVAPQFVEPRYNPLARYQDPPRFPWRLMGGLALVGAVFVIIGVATMGDPDPPAVDNVLRPGDCVVFQPNGDAAEALCSDPHDGTMVVMVSIPEECPAGTEVHRDRQGMGLACIDAD